MSIGSLLLVNAAHPYRPQGPGPALAALEPESSVLLCQPAARALGRLLDAVGGRQALVPVSGWRSRREQSLLYAQSVEENGPAFTAQYVAKPGCSEHETGLAMDIWGCACPRSISSAHHSPIEGVCRAFRRQGARFGFILRYPQGKEAVTGIAWEPWHFRYVGTPHAQIMEDRRPGAGRVYQLPPLFCPADSFSVPAAGGACVSVFSWPGSQPPEDLDLQAWEISGADAGGWICTRVEP